MARGRRRPVASLEDARLLNQRADYNERFSATDPKRLIITRLGPAGTQTIYDYTKLTKEIIRQGTSCPRHAYYRGENLYGFGCEQDSGRYLWTELVDLNKKTRSRFHPLVMVIGPKDDAIAIVRRQDRDRVVRLHAG